MLNEIDAQHYYSFGGGGYGSSRTLIGLEEKKELALQASSGWVIWFWVALNIVSSILQFLTTPLWIAEINPIFADPFVVYQVASFMFFVFFAVTVVVLCFTNGNNLFAFIRKVTPRGLLLLLLSGVSNTLNGILVVIASPVDRTPPVISSTVPNVIFVLMIAIIWFLHRFRFLPEPIIRGRDFLTLEFGLFASLYVLCIYSLVSATNEQAVLGGQVFWWFLFVLGILFGYLSNQFQEIFFKSEDFEESTNEITNYLFAVTLIPWVFGLLLVWVDFIPGVAMTHASFSQAYLETLKGSFTGMGFLYNFLYALGNYLSYVASVKTNLVNTGLTMLVNPVATTLVIAISYDIKALTPDKSIIDVYFFFPMIMSSILMTFFYTQWYKGTRSPGSLLSIVDYLDRYEPETIIQDQSVQ